MELLVALLAPNYIQRPAKQALQSMSDSIPTRNTYSDYSKPIHFVSGPAIPATEGRPDFHESTYKPPKLTNPYTKNTFAQLHAHIYNTGCTPLTWHRSQGTAIPKYNGKKGVQGSRLVHVLDPIGKAFFTKKTYKPPSQTTTLVLPQTEEGNLPSYAKTAPTSNLPEPNAISSTTIITAPMPSAALDTRTVMKYVKSISSTIPRMPTLENKGTTGPAAKYRLGKTIAIR